MQTKTLKRLRNLYRAGFGQQATEELHALSTDALIRALHECGIAHSKSHGRPLALRKAAHYICFSPAK